MAYSNHSRSSREWDQGKDYNYNNFEGNSNRRQRDEDYNGYYGGTEKRRKYDNAPTSYKDDYSAWSSTSQQGPPYMSSGADSWQDPQRGGSYQGNPSNSNRRRLVPSEPSPHVIFLGLDSDHTEADVGLTYRTSHKTLHGYLLSVGCILENVTIIRDRSSGTYTIRLSKGFGFAQFSSTEHAKAFVTPRFPFISVPPPASHGATAMQAYKMALENGAIPQGRRVKIDFSQSAHPPERGGRRSGNDGTRDIGNTQAPVVLLRGLDFSSSPDIVAQGLRTSAGPEKEGAKGMTRIVLIKDKYSGASWGFAFVEFIDVQSSSTFLAELMSPQLHPSGFRIAERPVAASFAHPYSFQPLADDMIRDDGCVSATVAMGGLEGGWARYWDDSAMVEELQFAIDIPATSTATGADKDAKLKKKKESAKVVAVEEPVPVEASALPVSDKPVTLSFKGGAAQKTGPIKVTVTSSLGFTTDNLDAPNTEDDPTMIKSADHDKASTFKKVAPLIASRKVASNISKWNHVQDELKVPSPTTAPIALPPVVTAPIEVATADSNPTAQPDENEFADVKTLACLLCSRRFKSLDQLGRHNKESDLHKNNYKDATLRQVAAQKVQALKTPPPQPKYRDRASERRILHNQPEVPHPEPSSHRKHRTPTPPPSPPAPGLAPAKDENNIGNKLLKKMGWSEGTGLGTEGDGRVDPVTTAVYAQGVGLGASKGKELGKYAESYSGGYINAVRDSAKERYHKEGPL
ncbi:hypothetical protein Clacol_006234 [Clathrus columnatus]|uniref:Uncharacterized protein n=1 Tax=Clathrus columnatus TaxID=1419009 RepID=A0AAV5AGA7_9AGAM|nr:hypothetical protein Clacol_006234 [Clathrus columnatus]